MGRILSFFLAIILSVFLALSSSSWLVLAQQPYVGLATSDCTNAANNNNNNNSVLGYACNGAAVSCQSYLMFRSQPPYNTSVSIAALLGADSSQVASINSVSASSVVFDAGRLVIVPVNCSCSGQYYQVNSSYVVQSGDGYFLIANNTYQALSTCQALQRVNNVSSTNLAVGENLIVPVRCACPTQNQTDSGVKYLLNYPVTSGDGLSTIAARFGVDANAILAANDMSSTSTIYAFTNLLIPSVNPPNISETVSPPPPPPSTPPTFVSTPSSKGSSKTWIYITVGVLGGFALIVCISVIFFLRCFRQRRGTTDQGIFSNSFEVVEKPDNKKLDEDSQDLLESISSVAQSINVYSFNELQQATDNFSPGCLIKGSVYCGKIKGDLAAIKKMDGDVSREVEILNKVNHFNVLKLSGICFNDGNWYFVYEYAVNGSLDDWIFCGDSKGRFLTWTQRVQIMLDVATGLNYLHYFTAPPLVHKDIRSSNILLDSEMRAKIASLDLARSTETEEGEFVMTRHIVGTKGYMAPEYLENGLISAKLDVYAFGVLLLETIGGKEIVDLCSGENRQLVDVVHRLTGEDEGHDNLFHFIDPSIREDCPLDLFLFILRMIETCLDKNPAARPSMEEIIQSLSKVLATSQVSQ